jgi:hypothetical protein
VAELAAELYTLLHTVYAPCKTLDAESDTDENKLTPKLRHKLGVGVCVAGAMLGAVFPRVESKASDCSGIESENIVWLNVVEVCRVFGFAMIFLSLLLMLNVNS